VEKRIRDMIENMFRIIVPAYNSINWIEKCIWSISNQSYLNWSAIVIDDSSNDGTTEKIKNTLINDKNKSHFRYFARNMNVGALENTIFGTNSICKDDEDIIVIVDGDDWLIDSNVLSYLNEVYQDQNIWLTYGNYINLSTKSLGYFNRLLTDTRTYRKSNSFNTSHLRTYKYKIWKKIKDNDFKNEFGKYYKITGDVAVMIPLIEMAGIKRIKYIEKPLYVYNDENPINDCKKNAILQLQINAEIRNKSSYEEL
jgi:glycosyltransferase involved in cell wall biosynthesis